MTVRFYLKNPDQSESLIVAQVLWQNYQLRYTSKKKVLETYWDKDSQLVKRTSAYPKYSEINQYLKNMKNDIERIFTRYENDNGGSRPAPAQLKELLDVFFERKEKKEAPKPVLFMEFFKDFIGRSQRGVRINIVTGQALSVNTIKTYNTALGHLEEYCKGLIHKLEWDEINLNFHADYTDFLMNEYELCNNAVGKDFQIIKLVCLEAYYAGINKYDHFKNRFFSVMREESYSIHLNDQQINLLWNVDLTHNTSQEETRDLFVFGCVTGLRYGNYANIKSSNIKGNRLHVKQVKTGKNIEVPLLAPLAQAIINKYDNNLPKGTINQQFNKQLRAICENIPQLQHTIERNYSKGGNRITEMIPMYDLIKSHVARRSFASNEVEKGTPVPEIMAITGQKTEKSFWKYVKLDKSVYADMYAARLIERHGLVVQMGAKKTGT